MRKAIRWITIVGSCAAVLALSLGLAVYLASRKVPEFYSRELAKPPAQQVERSRELIHHTAELAGSVRKPGPWQAEFTVEQINGWLAVDVAKNHPNLLPPSMHEPRVAISPKGIQLGCRWQNSQLDTVLSLSVDAYLHETGAIALRLHGAKAGNVPLPLNKILDEVARATGELELQVRWFTETNGDPVALITVPPPEDESDATIVIERLELRDGALTLAGRTVPPESPVGESAQAPSNVKRQR